jgi:two-component system, sensor histidine kinase PdtaS
MKSDQTSQADGTALDKLRRHVRILVDLGRLAARNFAMDRYLDQAVVQVARAVEIDHVKVITYRRRTADLLMKQGSAGRRAWSARRRSRSTFARRPAARTSPPSQP